MSCFNCVKTELHELAFQEECWVSIELTLISLMWSFIIDKPSFFLKRKNYETYSFPSLSIKCLLVLKTIVTGNNK